MEIARRPEEVFAYLDELARHAEWQASLVSVHVETEGSTRVGSRAKKTRRLGSREQTMTYESTSTTRPRSFAFRGLAGPIRPVGRGTVEPVGDGSRSRLTIELELSATVSAS